MFLPRPHQKVLVSGRDGVYRVLSLDHLTMTVGLARLDQPSLDIAPLLELQPFEEDEPQVRTDARPDEALCSK